MIATNYRSHHGLVPPWASRSGVILLSAWFWLWAAHADSQALAEPFPLAQAVAQMRQTLANSHIVPTGLTGEDYLKVAGGIVDYFHLFQAADGRIIDPFAHREVQYSTPCYAWAAAALVTTGRHPRLLPSASLALDCALQQLAQAKPADNHGDFFTFPAMLAYENLRERVSAEQRGQWEGLLRRIDPYKLLLEGCRALVVRAGGQETFTLVWPENARLQRGGQWIESRNGYLEEVFADLPGNRVIYTLEPQAAD